MNPYQAEVIDQVSYGPGTSNGIRVGVFRVVDTRKELVGEYVRNYPSLFDTFFPFESAGQELALYSPDYTTTRILRLPDCVDIGGEEPSSNGFCPVDFLVPTYADMESVTDTEPPFRFRVNNPSDETLKPTHRTWQYSDPATGEGRTRSSTSRQVAPVQYYPFGFVAGCIWADDSTWKVQFLDLSRASQGVIGRDERFGYLELPEGVGLRQAVDMADYGHPAGEEWAYQIAIAARRRFDLRGGRAVDPLA